ncbi:MAG: DUF373 family protein [Candidatus Micrarchaeaceae archaeon]
MENSGERLLVLAVDIDNDLYTKTKVSGPVIGRNANVKAATQLAIADPEDTDSNTIFEAVRKYDELRKQGYKVIIATLTGAEKEGYVADAELSRQIDMLLERFKIDACVLVTDGASDMRVVPLMKSRIKINSVDIVRMKQAEQFENAYFTLLEKLKEPHYARIVFGIPAVLLLLFSISYYFNLGWQLPVMLIGIYLIAKGLGIEDELIDSAKRLGFSIDRLSFLFYILALSLFFIAILAGYGSYSSSNAKDLGSIAYSIEDFLILFSASLMLYTVGRIIDYESRRMQFRAIKQGIYMGYGFIAISLFYLISAWIIGQIYFWQLLLYSSFGIIAGYAISIFSNYLRITAVRNAHLTGKDVMNDIGAYIGKVISIQSKSGKIQVKTNYGTVISYDLDRITGIAEKVIIR